MPPAKRSRPSRSSPPDPQQAPVPGEAAGSSTVSSAADAGGFFADAGPAFDHDAAGELPAPEAIAEPVAAVQWEQPVVESLLEGQGVATHALIGRAEDDFLWEHAEKRAAAGPLTRILNRYPVTAAAAGTGDEIALMIALGAYVGRSVKSRQAAVKAARAGQEEVLGAPVFDANAAPAAPAAVEVDLDDVVTDLAPRGAR